MPKIYCHYRVPLFIDKDATIVPCRRRPCTESIYEPILLKVSDIKRPHIKHPSSMNSDWAKCGPCDHWYCPKHWKASLRVSCDHTRCRELAKQRRMNKCHVVNHVDSVSPKESISKKREFSVISKLRLEPQKYEKEELNDIPPLIQTRTFSTQTEEEDNEEHELYLDLQANYTELNSKYTILKTLSPAKDAAHQRKIEVLNTDIQRLEDQVSKLTGIIADNLHHIQDIEAQKHALTEWIPNIMLRKLILEKMPITAPQLEELSTKQIKNPLSNQ